MIPTQQTLAPAFLVAFSLALVGSLAGCTPAPEVRSSPADDPPPEAAAGPTHRVDIPPTVRRNLGIQFAQVQVRNVAQTLRVPGAFELEPRARREVRMALPGTVQLLVDQYEHVESGTPLFRFRSPVWPTLQHEILEAEMAIDTARAEIVVQVARLAEARTRARIARERLDALADAEFKRADLEAQAAELEASLPRLEAEIALARTRLSNAERSQEHAIHRASTITGIPESELREDHPTEDAGTAARQPHTTLDWIEVRASGPGLVEALAVTDGAFVEPPSTVVSIVDPSRLRFRALALQADLALLEDGATARIVPPTDAGGSAGAGRTARLTLGLEAHPEERTITLLATPEATSEPAPAWMRPGVSAFLEIVTESTTGPVLAVPRSAVVQDGLTHVLFRRDPGDPNAAIRVEADLGVDDGRWVELRSGVMRGDDVVLAGAYELKLATQQGGAPQKGGHVHADGSFHEDH